MMEHINGIFVRGVLLGYAKVPDNYTGKDGIAVKRDAHLLGVERDGVGKFGESRKITVSLNIPEQLMKDMKFIDSISLFQGHVVEIPLSGYADFSKRLYLSNDAEIISLSSHFDKLKSA
jgi:hypothetical protein